MSVEAENDDYFVYNPVGNCYYKVDVLGHYGDNYDYDKSVTITDTLRVVYDSYWDSCCYLDDKNYIVQLPMRYFK